MRAFPSRCRAVYEALARAAEAGQPCPTNGELCEIAGVGSIGTTSNMVSTLEREGAIAVERGSGNRVVTIMATGERTAGTIAKPHYTTRLDAAGRERLAAKKRATADLHSPVEAKGANQQTRMDIAARVDADQARRRARRDHWLALKQRKYDLPKPGRPLEEMPA